MLDFDLLETSPIDPPLPPCYPPPPPLPLPARQMCVNGRSASNVLEVKNEVDVDTVNHNAKADATR